MSVTDVVQVQPVKLTQKLGRYTKGLMTSIGIILVSTTLAIIGIQIDVDIIITVGFIIVGLSSIIFLVFLVLFLTSIKRLGRTNSDFYTSANKIFISFLYGLIFAAAGGANSYTDAEELLSQYVLSRVYGMIAITFFGFAFISINKLFKEFKEHKLYPAEEKRDNIGLPIIMGFILLVILGDTILRNFVPEIILNYVILAAIFVLVATLCYFMFILGNDWLKIDDDLNNQYFKMGGKTFNDRLKANILYISTIFIITTLLSLIYVVYYFIIYLTGAYSYEIVELVFSVGIFVGVMIIFLVIYIIRISLNFNKMAQLNTKTSNYGIFTAISLSFSPFLLIAGLFSNVEFYIGDELYLISRILLLLGVVLFALGSYFSNIILKNLKLNKEGFEQRKKDLILPISSLILFVLLLVDTIVRLVVWNFVYKANSIGMEVYNREFLWFGYLMGALFFLAIIPTIYGIITTSREFLRVIPAYGKIPLRLRKSKMQEQLQLYQVEPEQIAAKAEIAAKPIAEKPEAIHFCSSCGKELQDRYNFCAYCGDKKDTILKTCKNCGEVLEKGFGFCPICGTKK